MQTRLVHERMAERVARGDRFRNAPERLIALGAEGSRVLASLREGLGLVAAGLAIGSGIGVAFVATRALAALLFRVDPHDPPTLGLVGFVLLLVALLACYVPARRATRVDPMVALRYE